MSNDEQALFSAIDALLEQVAQDPLPPPAERKRLREAAGLGQDQIAKALQARRESVGNWEAGRSEPRPPKRAAYARLLEGLATRFPAPAADSPDAAPALAVPEAFTGPAPQPVPAPAVVPPSRPGSSSTAKPTASSRRPGAKKAVRTAARAAATTDPRFENGPLAVLDVEDGQVVAYCVGGLVLDVPAKTLPALVDWTLTEARLGQARLHRSGYDADPMLVLTPAALERYGLPTTLTPE
ncbi:helix-turn-helix transcriptional regulator, partial [Streptomyces avidinii]|uniref:helix-turn-helix transcriptional regulator n=1 Tax=Streptomyces avidinii TaxID=1895 RepID=UPI0037A0941E